jgi:hypothetical protein
MRISLTLLSLLLTLIAVGCATTSDAKREEPDREVANHEVVSLRERLDARRREIESEESHNARGRPRGDRARKVVAAVREWLEEEFRKSLNAKFGVSEPLQEETVMLEAVSTDGVVTEVPVVVKTRRLRSLTDPDLAPVALGILGEDNFAIELYANVPDPIAPNRTAYNQRVYSGDAADAIAMEAKLIVTLKGGEWTSTPDEEIATNAIAIRGLDLEMGLSVNTNKTYDDTLYVVMERSNEPTEVHEFRMTTESSNSREGVGRLDSKQVYYRRGLHKGVDFAYRLVGEAALGTRAGLEGEYQITGANIHSAYTSRRIDSTTPLSPNVSLGCQVIAMSKGEFEENFVGLLDGKDVQRFSYTIVEGTEIAEFDRILRSHTTSSILVRALPRVVP